MAKYVLKNAVLFMGVAYGPGEELDLADDGAKLLKPYLEEAGKPKVGRKAKTAATDDGADASKGADEGDGADASDAPEGDSSDE